jgi:hypothetical protein
MALDKTTPTTFGIGAWFPLGAEGEAGGEGSETHLPAPPELPLDLAQVLANQTQLIDVLTRSLENQRPNGGRPQDRMGDFLRLKPPTFAGSSNPLDADDWLRTIKRKLEAIGCPENQRVQLAAHQLSGMALAWWDTFNAAVRDATWTEFETAFREHHVPQGIVQLKEDEFRELTQGGRSVSEYVHKFTELARYTPDDVSTEAKKMARFLKGLRPELKTILASQDFLSFRTSQTKPYKWKGQGKKKKVTSRGNSKSSELSNRNGTRELDPLGFHPRDQASIDQLDPLRHVSASRVRAPFRQPRLQATNHQQMPIGTAETPVTSKTTAPS